MRCIKLKKIITIITTLILTLAIAVPAMASTVVEKATFAELIASNSEYSIHVLILPDDSEHLLLEIVDSNGNILVNDNTIPSDHLLLSSGRVTLTVPKYNVSIICSYDIKEAQRGRVFITNFPDNQTKMFKQFSIYSDSVINNFKVSGTLLGVPFISDQGSLLTFTDQIVR